MRHPKACRQCRDSKRKCIRDGHRVGEACEPCQRRNLACASSLANVPPSPYLLLPKTAPTQPKVTTSETDDSPSRHSSFVSTQVAVRLVDYYLEKLHNRPHSLFHPTKLRTQVQDGSVNQALLLAICSLGARFDNDEDIRSLEDSWMDESKQLLLADLENVCVENAQTCILIANLYAAHLKSSSEALFFRIAISLLQIMDAGPVASGASLIDVEIKRRTWWTLFMADRWSSSSLGLPRQIPDTELAVDLPMDEVMFEALSMEETRLNVPWQPGIWAHMISLVQLFGPIQDLNRRSVYGNIPAHELEASVACLSSQLDNWERMLPTNVKMNEENFKRQIQRGTGGAFIALHLGYHHYATLLYFRFLEPPPLSSSPLLATTYRSKCNFHALSYSTLVKRARQEKGCEIVYPTVGHMAVVSSSVLLHTLLFGKEDDLQVARDALKANFAAILDLRRYWPNTAPMVQRLVTFQNFCLLSIDYRTHKLDGWMIRFLIEYSLPLEEKDVEPVMLGRDLDMASFSTRAQVLTEQGRYTSFAIHDGILEGV
ncbi:fungal-specific transcription factor domain-containing protein [Thelonectria olida]|uniref:Fungal-specific transcription factor domain-containing protein n=1 Tax=Thelonectria olida TaxID=1576542 RepID=A0A9P8VUZ8_9HYPO|nr:fungal-specific transcription factor domain-containing protein [Thelonectria olida]